MSTNRAVNFTGISFQNPFLLSSAPPTESESNILRAFEAGWGGVVTKTIGLHPVTNVVGAKAKFMRTSPEDSCVSMKKRPGAALHSSWNWELISDKTIDWWLPRIRRIKEAFPDRVLIASIMAGSGNDKELKNWQRLAQRLPGRRRGRAGAQLLLSPHGPARHGVQHREGRRPLLGGDRGGEGGRPRVPVWCKLTPATAEIEVEAGACFRGGADAIVSSNTFPSIPIIDPETLEFEINVDGFVSSGGLGGPAILPLSLAKMAQMTRAFPDRSFSGIGGISDFQPGAVVHPARMRNCAGVHRRDARPGGGAERDQAAAGGTRRVPRAERGAGVDRRGGLPGDPSGPDRGAVRDPPA